MIGRRLRPALGFCLVSCLAVGGSRGNVRALVECVGHIPATMAREQMKCGVQERVVWDLWNESRKERVGFGK